MSGHQELEKVYRVGGYKIRFIAAPPTKGEGSVVDVYWLPDLPGDDFFDDPEQVERYEGAKVDFMQQFAAAFLHPWP